MADLPGDLYQRLHAALLRCAPFESDARLRALFVDARLSAWRDALHGELAALADELTSVVAEDLRATLTATQQVGTQTLEARLQ